MNWSTKRKIIYAIATIALVLAFAVYQSRSILFPDPTCLDKKKNGYESGVDCGGTCSLRCSSDISLISAEWARAVKVNGNNYDLVALLSNKNINSSPTLLPYSFVVFNNQGKVIRIENGTTSTMVSSSFPVIAQNINLSDVPAKVLIKLNQTPYYATLESPSVPPVRVTNFTYEPGSISRIYVNIVNTTRNVYLKLPLRMVAYDEHDNAIAVGESIIPTLDKEEQKQVAYTWHNILPAVPTKVRAYPIISPVFAK